MLAIIDEYGKIDRQSLDNLTYALKSLKIIKDNHFSPTYGCIYSSMLHGSVEQMIKEGLIDESVEDMGEEHSHMHLPCYSLTWKGSIVADSNSSEKRVMIREIKEKIVSPFRFAVYCRLLDDGGDSLNFPERFIFYGFNEVEIRVYEELHDRLKQDEECVFCKIVGREAGKLKERGAAVFARNEPKMTEINQKSGE